MSIKRDIISKNKLLAKIGTIYIPNFYHFNIIIVILFLNCINLSSISNFYKIILPDGKQINLPYERVNDYDYINFKHFAKYFLSDSKYIYSTGEIIDKNIRLRCLPASFFILYQNHEDIKISQMTLPAINLKEEIFVPVNTFFQSLNSLGYIKNRIEGKVIYLESGNNIITETEVKGESKQEIIEQTKQSVREVPSKDSFNLKSEQTEKQISTNVDTIANSKRTLNADNDNKADKKSKHTENLNSAHPTQYSIPKKLQRKEIEEMLNNLRNEDSSKSNMLNLHFDDFLKKNWEKNYISHINNIYDKNLIASLKTIVPQEAEKIIELRVENNDGKTEIHLKADGIIKTYQKPEINGKELTLRLPGIENAVEDFSKQEKKYPISSIKSRQINNNLIYIIRFKSEIEDYSTKRKSQNEIIISVKYKDKSKTAEEKSGIQKEINPDKKKSNDKITNVKSDINSEKRTIEDKKKWDLDVIVIDPGHGGEDPGAISIHNHKEKDIALKIAKKLKKQLQQKLPEIKVIMTRDDDTFIELYRRGQIANKSKGKLFISIHLNSMPQKPCKTNGFESYILRPGRNEDAIRVANKENSSIKFEKDQSKYKKLTEEELIIATMAQSAFVKLSEKFASILQQETGKITNLQDRGINQAGFYVLVGASMPNLLFEAGFLSNEKDEKFLISDKGQGKIAKGMFNAIKRYAKEYRNIINGSK
jgi:N-acetylmuramoyl-L-alanine amidase